MLPTCTTRHDGDSVPARSDTLGGMATATAPPGTVLWSPDLETDQRMAELEIFGDERVELLDGVLVAMSPKAPSTSRRSAT